MQQHDRSQNPKTPKAEEAEAVQEPRPGETPAAQAEAEKEDPVARLESENARLKDQLLRALAETENVRRRGQRDREEQVRYAASGFARDLLNVADNLRRALDAVPAAALETDEALKTLADGVALTERELLAVFERNGIRKIAPDQGERFDPNLHQAMFEVPNTGQPAGTVVQLMQAGWIMHDRLLRPALIGIAKGSPSDGNGAAREGNGAEG
ncbi:MAG TPA: nucleotide exchange factor GrpE [Alphaproteobacteria bacterium]|nr:nucleotide exchange factor GrpE [Alphaproteobacteria bacterium]